MKKSLCLCIVQHDVPEVQHFFINYDPAEDLIAFTSRNIGREWVCDVLMIDEINKVYKQFKEWLFFKLFLYI